jgi:hypothetical protein
MILRRLLALTTFVAALGAASLAHADEAARKALIDEAVAAAAANDHARALERAETALAMHATASLMRFIAEEHEKLGHLPEAYDAGRDCLRLAEKEPPSPNHDAVLVGCRSLVTELRPRVALVAWIVPGTLPVGLVVSVAAKQRDVARGSVAVSAGAVRVEARAPGYLPFESTVEVVAGAEATVTLVLEREPAPEVAKPPAPVFDEPPRKKLVGPILASVGVAALITSGVLRLVSNGKYDDLRTQCASAAGCPDGESQKSSIQRLDAFAVGGAIVGAALVVTGVTLFVLDKPAEPKQATAWIDAGPLGFNVNGRF